MKHFMKWMTILGVIVSAAGLGMIAAGAAMGGTHYAAWALRDAVWRRGYDWEHWHTFPDEILEAGDIYQKTGDGVPKEKDIEIAIPRDLENGELTVKEEVLFENVREIEMAAIGNVIWKESDELKEGQIRIQKCNDGEDYRYGQKRDKLKILPETYPQGIMNSIIILVPKGNWFKELYVEVSAGEFWADGLQAEEIFLESKASVITALHIQADQQELEAKAGVIECQIEEVSDVSAECDMGQIGLSLIGKKEDFSYEMECDMGQILFGETDEGNQGVHWEKEIDNPGVKNMELECRAGVITVNYEQHSYDNQDGQAER